MRRIAMLGVVLALAGAGCSSGGTPQAAGQLGVGTDPATTTGISVTGQGRVSGSPDTVIVDLGVSVMRQSVDAAVSDAATLATKLIAALESGGVAEKDIQTSNYALNPQYDYSKNTQQILGYRVTNTVSAKIRTIDKAGKIIDAATGIGGNDVVVQSVRFDIEDNTQLLSAAREAAWNDAKAKADQLASLAGRTLGSAQSITETVTSTPPPVVYGAIAQDARESTPIQPGEQTLTVTITVQFAFGS